MRVNNCFPKELSIYIEPSKTPTTECSKLKLLVEKQFSEINIYDVYGKCWRPTEEEWKWTNTNGLDYKLGITAQDYTPWLFPEHKKYGLWIEDGVVPPCAYFKGITNFFNEDTVKWKLNAQ